MRVTGRHQTPAPVPDSEAEEGGVNGGEEVLTRPAGWPSFHSIWWGNSGPEAAGTGLVAAKAHNLLPPAGAGQNCHGRNRPPPGTIPGLQP